MSSFFAISRVATEEDFDTMYFHGFEWSDLGNGVETWGSERWEFELSLAHRFDSFTEAKAWFDVMNKNTDRYAYEIVLYGTEIVDGKETPKPHKDFLTTQEL